MDKIKFAQLGHISLPETVDIQIGDATITVTPRIPFETFLDMVQWAINFIVDDRPFISEPLRRVVMDMAILKYYTNFDVSFMDDPTFSTHELFENYDLLISHNAIATVRQNMDGAQRDYFEVAVAKTAQSIVDYRNSAQGIVDQLTVNAKENTEALENAMSLIKDPDNMANVNGLMAAIERLGNQQA